MLWRSPQGGPGRSSSRRSNRRLAELLFAMALVACAACDAGLTSDADDSTQRLVLDELGVSLELPLDWQATHERGVVVLSGPEASEVHQVTITVQGMPLDDRPIEQALADGYAGVSELPHFTWLYEEPAVLSSQSALRYGLQVEWNETLLIEHGAFLRGPTLWLDLRLAAAPALNDAGAPVFEHLLSGLTVFTPALW